MEEMVLEKFFGLGAVAIVFMFSPTLAFACADGPDAYRVVGVESNDTLNVRSGPGFQFGVVGEVPHNGTGLQNLDQVPISCDDPSGLNEYERRNFWTKIRWDGEGRSFIGWAKSKFLRE